MAGKKANKKIKQKIKERVRMTIFGNLPDGVDTEPKYKKRLDEEVERKTAVFTFGRFNPPTEAHQRLVERLIKTAQERGAEPMVFLAHRSDKTRNPLKYDDRIAMSKKAFGDIVKKSKAKTAWDIAVELNGQYDRLIMVVGSDRVTEFRNMLMQRNRQDYNYADIQVISAGERDPDSTGLVGFSTRLMRDYAVNGNIGMFRKGLPDRLKGDAQKIMDLTKQRLTEESLREAIETRRTIGGGVQLRKANAANRADNRIHRPASERLKNTPDRADITREKAESRAMSRVYMDAGIRAGAEAFNNPDPKVRQAEIQKMDSEMPKFRKYRDEEERNLKRASIKPVKEEMIVEAKYQGETVKLNKPIRNSGGKKKFKVYTTHPKTGNVIKVQFGDPNMSIKRDSDDRRSAFRSRHGCDALTFEDDRHKAGYWSCKMWEKGKSVSSITEDLSSAERALKIRTSKEYGVGAGKDLDRKELRGLNTKADSLIYSGDKKQRDRGLKIKRDLRARSRQKFFEEDELDENVTKSAKNVGKSAAIIGTAIAAGRGLQALGNTKVGRTVRREYQNAYDTLKQS